MEKQKPSRKSQFIPYQIFRFLCLNAKILLGVYYDKRLPKFAVKYKISFVTPGDMIPKTMINTRKPPQVGDIVQLARKKCEVNKVVQLMPPRGHFCYLQAICKIVEE